MKFIPMAALLTGLAALPALAQTAAPAAAPAQGNAPAATASSIPAGHIRAEQLLDRDVYSTDNVEIGEVEDLVIDPAQGRITAVVIEVENRLGITQKHVSVPLDRLRVAPGERRVTINMASGDIRSLPAFNR
ncbi:Sporulation protein YlmC, PRC-barrel domain family [Roseomonas rosea]|jgi:sporulation protein YlmC with PRC-barrel domain|uniref:Sporulation protein YlmC, PRC-barrel domain family n=1 Tax=Muricoccus roseus TaxID=198092 RepID=A0A1M6FQF0_9PROT|nr:PRC-barrel domain-containing protein [Roseomonas rosea]SHI99930.1 Sporulation protein YlmC, PRC-barrel domain family [Roseomonas rosea]